MENALDAAESIEVLPDVSITIEELTEEELNELRGMESRERVDLGLFHKAGGGRKKSGGAAAAAAAVDKNDEFLPDEKDKASAPAALPSKKKERGTSYYRVTCEDNGCGMAHDRIPDMLGRVLSSSKYGVRQTRGKFGLGSKMALIWSKKSTGLPIEVRSAHSTEASRAPSYVSRCILDIDIYRNEPAVKLHEKVANLQQWRGTRIDVVVEGNWSTYKTHIMTYFQQLAIITPYAQMDFTFRALSNAAREVVTQYARRSEQMPPPAQEVKHHPSSVNHLIIQQLLKRTKAKSLIAFLSAELACVTRPLAARIVKELGNGFTEDMHPDKVDANKTIRLTSMLKSVSIFKPPDGSCLSPAGEYNLRLGIMKELHPDVSKGGREGDGGRGVRILSLRRPRIHSLTTALFSSLTSLLPSLQRKQYVATVSEQAAAFEGHPFIVEAGVSLGGQAVKDGINVYRFANRIPLLFEVRISLSPYTRDASFFFLTLSIAYASRLYLSYTKILRLTHPPSPPPFPPPSPQAGNDVVTQVANRRIHWQSYKIDPKRDRVGVFVSIVSTKIPFKGTGKEYIGDDTEEIRKCVKNALQRCCKQLKQHLLTRNAAR